jgi:DNA-binding MarR family transcriptional regulator
MNEPRWLSDEQQRAWRKFTAVFTMLPAALDAQLQRDAEITHFGYWVLAVLSESPDHALRMSDLAARSNASLSRVSHVVARLEERGWVRRQPSEDDRRSNLAELTESGLDKIVATAPGHVETVRSLVFEALTGEQVQQLGDICRTILQRLDPTGRLGVYCPPGRGNGQARDPS